MSLTSQHATSSSGLLVAEEDLDHVLELLVACRRRVGLGGLVAMLERLQAGVGPRPAHVEALHLALLALVVLPDVTLVQAADVCTTVSQLSMEPGSENVPS